MNSSDEAMTDTNEPPEEKEDVDDYGIPGKWIISRRTETVERRKTRKKFLDSFR